jgi:glycosyltransferase involved in cell wall biosynthesis
MKTQPPSILIGVPVFEGRTMVGETLESIARQDWTSFRVLIAVDGPDECSAAACAKYIDDPRFQLVQHRQRLGWAANLSWLISELREDYFCYWQQDDLCDPSYLRVLAGHAVEHPEASAIYADTSLRR